MLPKVKRHLRIPHNLEDADVIEYIGWSENDVIEAIYDSYDERLNIEKLRLDVGFQKAVTMMTAYYYENRLVISEVSIHEAPFSVTHAIQTLRAHKDRYLTVDADET